MNPVPPAEAQNALRAVSADIQQALDELAAALETEFAAVHAHDSAALDSSGERKRALLRRLEKLDAERQQFLREAPGARSRTDAAWSDIEQSLRTCQALNQRNGSVVNTRLHHIREALSILTGHAGEDGLYDQAGSVQSRLRSHALAEA